MTVVMPVFNGARDIGRALRSIADQSLPVQDIIVVDDGSTDDLSGALREAAFEGTLIRQPNRGQGAATNAGIRRATTSHVLFLDHDDEWAAGRLAWQVPAMQSAAADVVIGSVCNVRLDADGRCIEHDMGPARVMGAGLFTLAAFEAVGLLPEDGRIHEVFDWWSRAAGVIEVSWDARPALRRHIHGDNMTMQAGNSDRSDLMARIRDHRRRNTGSHA